MMSSNSNNNKNRSSVTASVAVVVSRLLLPDDANPAGNVHGGTTLRLMEEAGMIAATRHIMQGAAAAVAAAHTNGNKNNKTISAVLARFENMSFHEPLYVGEVASLTARPIFTSEHSILIQVVVTGENVFTGAQRVTNTGKLWYVPLLQTSQQQGISTASSVVAIQVPPIIPSVHDDADLKFCYENAKLAYEARKRMQENSRNNNVSPTSTDMSRNGSSGTISSNQAMQDFQRRYQSCDPNARSPAESEQTLCQVVLPGDCSRNNMAFGGFLMKLMDNAAACSAYRHCRTNVVTIAISSIDFLCRVQLGDVCTIHSRIVYCSTKTVEMEVKATVTCARTIRNNLQDKFVAFGRFTFASLDDNGQAISVPPLRLETREDLERAFHGEQRYKMAKQAREQERQRRFQVAKMGRRRSKL